MSDSTLDAFVASLVPPAFDRTTVSERRKAIEDAVTAKTGSVGFIESGSWSHGTSLNGHSDVDYMCLLLGTQRPALPSSALTAMKQNIAGSHWAIAQLAISSPTVKVTFYTSPHFEIVPAYYKRKHQDIHVFEIPGPDDEWVESIPSAHNKWVSDVNDRLNKKVKPLARLVKAWKYENSVPVSSFFLEMRTVNYSSDEGAIIYDMDLRAVFRRLVYSEMRSMNDPLGIVPRIPATSSEANRTFALRQARDALEHLEAADAAKTNNDRSTYWSHMTSVFGYDYPYPTW
ncbi:nucleotidyltransferase domain-containing protein [Mycolicibacterium mengxianglii]|uniref:nucleotidyltransferase domain-containing protein n=1 Tax=Mycolicibacterium mengxianglii TaxID=2736649 RepID=UPI0018D0BBFF|nr:nucleotidyltransferase [Mycolicibacterium mengxianglii]